MIEIRPYRPEDEPQCQVLLQEIFGDDQRSQQYYRLTTAFGAFVAQRHGNLVGLGAVWNNPMHPHAARSSVAVHPTCWGRGIGDQIFDALYQSARMPLVTSLWETQSPGLRFAKKHGFIEFRRTYTTPLCLSLANLAKIRDLETGALREGYEIVSLSNAVEGGQLREVAETCKEIYATTHQANPPADRSIEQWMGMVFREDLIAAGSFVARQGSHVIAIGLLHRGQHGKVMELGWRGVRSGYRGADDFVRTLSLRQVEYAAANGAETLMLESDSTDPWSESLRATLPFSAVPAWISMKRSH